MKVAVITETAIAQGLAEGLQWEWSTTDKVACPLSPFAEAPARLVSTTPLAITQFECRFGDGVPE
jgi:hypothetical protein